jgi:hypothetical protein
MPVFAQSICDAVAGNLVANCGFEDGSYSSTIGGNTNTSVPNSWMPNAAYDLEPGFNHLTTFANSGTFALSIGNFDNQPVPSLSQALSDVNGDLASGSIYLAYGGGTGGDPNAFFDVLINGVTVLAEGDTFGPTYRKLTFSFVATGSDVLTLEGNTNPSEWFADDVVITQSAFSTPEPESMVLLATVAGLCVLALRRRGVRPIA